MQIYLIFDEPYAIDIYELTGTADSPVNIMMILLEKKYRDLIMIALDVF